MFVIINEYNHQYVCDLNMHIKIFRTPSEAHMYLKRRGLDEYTSYRIVKRPDKIW